MLDADDLGPADEALLDLLQEGRVTAPFAADATDYSLQYTRDRLGRLVEHGNARKVYEGLYELVHDPRDETDGNAEGTETAWVDAFDDGGDVDAILADWTPPTEVDADRARREVRRAVEWLADEGGHKSRSEFVDALAGESEFGERTWWERAVQPGLRDLADDGLVEYRRGYHDYRWVGETDE